MSKVIVVATGNAHKVVEIEKILSAKLTAEFKTLKEMGVLKEPEETGTTFKENALIKARAAHEATGLAAIADDSGLIVDALDGAPGVYSARYAGEHGNDKANNDKLLRELADVPDEERTARFASVVAYITADGKELCGEGFCEGMIGRTEKGDGGFGYDPLFLPKATPGKTMAELTMDEKNAISHRGAALADLLRQL